jgi:hypothetical protein
MPTLTLHTIPALILTPPTLVEVGAWQIGAGGISPTLEISLAPGQGELLAWLDPPPLRERAELTLDDGTTFSGIVQAVRLGASPSLTLEA